MAASTAIRNNLEAGDQALRSLMTQMEQVVNPHLGEPAPDKKKPEPLKPDALLKLRRSEPAAGPA